MWELANYHLGFISLCDQKRETALKYLENLKRRGSNYAVNLTKSIKEADDLLTKNAGAESIKSKKTDNLGNEN